jgi:cephalosporin-C deacetylase
MARFDLPLELLALYKPERTEERDFDEFWASTLVDVAKHPLEPRFVAMASPLESLEVFDASFAGYGGQRVAAWLILPAIRERRLPCVVEFLGYGGGRSYPWDHLLWSAAGYAHFVMDNRGQGSGWSHGITCDEGPATGYSLTGWFTRGIESPEAYYYRRLIADAARAIEAAASHPAVDPGCVAVHGISQGGGLSIAAAALSDRVRFLMPEVPGPCHHRRAVELTDSDPYAEITRYLSVHRGNEERVFRALSYFDCVNFAARTKLPALYSVGLMDNVCPPSTIFAAYNWHAGPKEIRVYRYNGHEGGGIFHARECFGFAKREFGRPASTHLP